MIIFYSKINHAHMNTFLGMVNGAAENIANGYHPSVLLAGMRL